MTSKELELSAFIKYIEFYLHKADKENLYSEEFKDKFLINKNEYPLLNQHFGLIKLLPLLLIRQKLNKDADEKLKMIRNSIAHGDFEYNEKGFTFRNNKNSLFLTYEELNKYIYDIENNFYNKFYNKK